VVLLSGLSSLTGTAYSTGLSLDKTIDKSYVAVTCVYRSQAQKGGAVAGLAQTQQVVSQSRADTQIHVAANQASRRSAENGQMLLIRFDEASSIPSFLA
jgi:expansin (peptidoglycan-binding protein)